MKEKNHGNGTRARTAEDSSQRVALEAPDCISPAFHRSRSWTVTDVPIKEDETTNCLPLILCRYHDERESGAEGEIEKE